MIFVLLLTRHKKFGWIADPWIAEYTAKSMLMPDLRCTNPELVPETGKSVVVEKEIVTRCQAYSDHEILRMFAPKGTKLAAFLHEIPDELLRNHIRPFIDQKLNDILLKAVNDQIPLYLKSDEKILTPSMLVTPDPNVPEPWFCFTKGTDGTRYVLDIQVNEHPIHLKEPGTVVVTDTPCWLIFQQRLFRFRDGFEGRKITPFLNKDFIRVPPSAEKKFFESFILKTLKTGQVKAEGFQVHHLQPDRSLQLSLETDWQGNPVMIIWFRYGHRRIMRGKKQQVFTEMKLEEGDYAFYRIARDAAWESEIYEKCVQLGLLTVNESMFVLPGKSGIKEVEKYRMVEWINTHRLALEKIPVTIRQEGLNYHLGTISHSLTISTGHDWFDIHSVVRFGDLEIPFVQLKDHLLEGIREFELPDGFIAVIPEEWFARYHDLFAFSLVSRGRIRISHRHFRLVAALELPLAAEVHKQVDAYNPASPDSPPVPVSFKGTLRPYQLEGVGWLNYLYRNRFGGCLADDMGLGKTIQTLALLLQVKEDVQRASMIVMPASLIHNWRNEARRFAPSLRILIHTGSQRSRNCTLFDAFDLVLTTYGTCRNDMDFLADYHFHYLILDESQVIRNPEALTSKAIYGMIASHRLVLTGTPISNTLTDLWSQMEFLNPGMLGNLASFKRLYVNAFDPERDAVKVERLKMLVAPFILRRTKTDVEPDLPPLTIEYRYCEMTDAQQRHYEIEKSAVRNEILAGIESGALRTTSVQVLRALIRMRQSACHPVLVDQEYSGESGKLVEVIRNLEILREENQKVLIFSSFVKHLKILEKQFIASGWGYNMLTGSTIRREAVIDEFRNNSDHHLFLISLKAGGVGLNLTEAGYIFILDPWWNVSAELQAINRAHRIGQDKKVIAYKFISKDTIEEKMLLLQQRKQLLSDTFIPTGNPMQNLSAEETAGLFE